MQLGAAAVDHVGTRLDRTIRAFGIELVPNGNNCCALYGQPGLAQALDHAFEVGWVLVRQDPAALLDRVIGVDSQRFLPFGLRVLGATEMAVAGGEQHVADVAIGLADEPALQQSDRVLVALEREVILRHEVQESAAGSAD